MPLILRDENNSGSRKGLYWLIPVLLIVALLYSMSTRSQSTNSNSAMPSPFPNPTTNGAIVSGTGNLQNLPNAASGTGTSGTGTSGTGIVSGTSY